MHITKVQNSEHQFSSFDVVLLPVILQEHDFVIWSCSCLSSKKSGACKNVIQTLLILQKTVSLLFPKGECLMLYYVNNG